MWRKVFIEHPETVGETYGEHLRQAWSFGTAMIGSGVACLVHALVPCLFKTTGSEAIRELHDRMVTNRHRQTPAAVARRRAMDAAMTDA